jgi:hypothetical protein
VSTRQEIYADRKLHGITRKDLQRFKDGIHVGDIIAMSEASVKDIQRRVHYKYEVIATYKHVFAARRTNRRGREVIVSMAYQKYMTEGENAVTRTYPQ